MATCSDVEVQISASPEMIPWTWTFAFPGMIVSKPATTPTAQRMVTRIFAPPHEIAMQQVAAPLLESRLFGLEQP